MDRIQTVLKRELKRLRRFAYALTGSEADADDLVHDLVVKVLEKGLPDMSDPMPWMITLCKNLWIDELRYREVRMRNVKSDADENLPEGDISVPDISTSVHCDRVVKGLQSLPEGQRAALSLVTIEGMSYAEAAKVLDVPIGTIMSRVARARALLLELFNDPTEVSL